MTGGGNFLLIADDAALDALALRLRSMPHAARIIVLAQTSGRRWDLPRGEGVIQHWVDSTATWGPRTLNDALKGLFLPQHELRVWVACEAHQARLICAQLVDDHGVAKHMIKATAWLRMDRVPI